MRLMEWMMEGSFDISEVPYRHSRVGLPRRMVWMLAAIFSIITFILVVAGAILTAIAYTEVRPPTADDNYQRYLGSDYRRVIGPLMMIISLMVFVMGIAYLLGRKISHKADKKQMALLRERLYPQTSLPRQQSSPGRGLHDSSKRSLDIH